MAKQPEPKTEAEKAADIVADAGGRVVGRTRLQKIAYLLEVAGVGDGFHFEYRHYGPYSEELAMASAHASSFDLLYEEEKATNWGGTYSIFTSSNSSSLAANSARVTLAKTAAAADPVELELAATALFLFRDGFKEAWKETSARKPDKAKGRMEKAKKLYDELRGITVPRRLPSIA